MKARKSENRFQTVFQQSKCGLPKTGINIHTSDMKWTSGDVPLFQVPSSPFYQLLMTVHIGLDWVGTEGSLKALHKFRLTVLQMQHSTQQQRERQTYKNALKMAQNENGNKHPMLFGSSSEILSPEAQKEPQQPPNILLWYSYAEPPTQRLHTTSWPKWYIYPWMLQNRIS